VVNAVNLFRGVAMYRKSILVVLSALVLLQLAGCTSEEESPAGPGEPGTVVIDAEPDILDAPWDITGPGSYSGSGTGDSTMINMSPGSYTISWGTVSGWIAPDGETQTLAAEGTVTFSGTYTEEGYPPITWILVPAGSFTMGTPMEELGHYWDESPMHTVILTHAFYIQSTEVTNQQYIELAQWAVDQGLATATDTMVFDNMDSSEEWLLDLRTTSQIAFSDGKFSLKEVGGETRPNNPVQHVTWYGAVAYCDWLSIKNGTPRAYDHDTWECNENEPYSATGYRLPTEAEWEYACRTGTSTAFANGPITERFCGLDPVLDEIGWYCGNTFDSYGHPVAQKIPNAWGLYDMHGNIWEWCNDWYREDYYSACGNPATDPVGASSAYSRRVLRGGNWQHAAEICRSGDRNSYQPIIRHRYIGFRPVRSRL